jgi:serine kinase of HPr protein (carbohydrate metabolism regulator)
MADKQLLFDLDNLASFYVNDGKTIAVEKKCEDCENDIRLFILGTCLGTILIQRNILALHASAFEYNGEAVLICGNSGVGKSSMANAFRLEGHKMLSDDISPIDFEEDTAHVISGYPQSKMWIDSLNSLKIEYQNLDTIRKEVAKRKLPIKESFVQGRRLIKKMYFISRYDKDEIELIPLLQGNKLNAILKMTYRRSLIRDMGFQMGHFLNSSKFASCVDITKIRRPHDCKIEDLKAAIQNDLLNN